MADKPNKESRIAPERAAEVDETELDRAVGGTESSIYFHKRSAEGASRQDVGGAQQKAGWQGPITLASDTAKQS